MGFENGHLVRVVLTAEHKSDGDKQVNVVHYDLINSAVPGEPANDPQTLADTFRDDVLPHFTTLYSDQWSILPVVVEDEKDPQNPLAPRNVWVSGTVHDGGALESDQLPRAMCMVVTLRTDQIGRRHTGRMFVGGSNADADVSGENWSTGAQSNVNAFVTTIPLEPDLASGASTSVAHWCVYSRTQRAADLDPYASPVQTYQVRPTVHWLRSRAVK